MKQAEIWDVNFNPSKGQEQRGIRPAVIISGNVMNDHYNLIIACPMTSKIKNMRGNVILNPTKSNGLKTKSEILVFHVKSISKERLIKKIGNIEDFELDLIKENLNKILNY